MKFFKLAGSALALALLSTTSASGAIIYNDFYEHFNSDSSLEKDGQNPPDDVATWAYAANAADAFGGVIGFDRAAKLDTFSVIMSNWNGWDPTGSTTGTATAGYDTDLTLELYAVDRSGGAAAPGTLLTADTESHSIAGRQIPDASNASFVGNGTDSLVDWDLGGLDVGSELLFMVRVDGLTSSVPLNSPLNSLNIAAVATGTNPDVTAGIDTDNGVFWRSEGTFGNISRFEAGQVMARAQGTLASVPVPGALPLLLVGLGGLGVVARRKRKAA